MEKQLIREIKVGDLIHLLPVHIKHTPMGLGGPVEICELVTVSYESERQHYRFIDKGMRLKMNATEWTFQTQIVNIKSIDVPRTNLLFLSQVTGSLPNESSLPEL